MKKEDRKFRFFPDGVVCASRRDKSFCFLARRSARNDTRERIPSWPLPHETLPRSGFLAKGSVESTHKVPTSHYHTKHCHAAVVSLGVFLRKGQLNRFSCERVS